MDLLDIPLPECTLTVDLDPSTFFGRCESIARANGWRVDRRRSFAGTGYDQLNLYLGNVKPNEYPMIRMVSVPQSPRRLRVDVVTSWTAHPIPYDEYLEAVKQSYAALLGEYKRAHAKRFRLGVPKRPESIDLRRLDCGRISYAAEKFAGLTRSLATGRGDARERLISAFWTFHVLQPDDLPQPLRKHLAWILAQITKREARHQYEGTVEATVSTMKTATAAKILERLVDLAEAIEALDAVCHGRRGLPG